MIKKWVVLMALLWSYLPLAGQVTKDSLHSKIVTADTVVLLSHQDLYVHASYADYRKGINDYRRKIVTDKHQVNDSVVTERVRLNKYAVDTLLQILADNRPEEIPMDAASCFEPHHAIVLYDKGRCSYISICFGCRRYATSGDLLLPDGFLATDRNWAALKAFFIRHGLTYKMEGK